MLRVFADMTVDRQNAGDHYCNVDGPATPQLRIIIVGAGLSGLSAGIQCALSGHSVLILESAKEMGEVCPLDYQSLGDLDPLNVLPRLDICADSYL